MPYGIIIFYRKFKILTTCPPPLIMCFIFLCQSLKLKKKGTLLLCFPSEITRKKHGETFINTSLRRDLFLSQSRLTVAKLLFMELDDLDLGSSWPLDQISFASSSFRFPSSDQPVSPLWSFSSADGGAELCSAPTLLTDYSLLLASKLSMLSSLFRFE